MSLPIVNLSTKFFLMFCINVFSVFVILNFIIDFPYIYLYKIVFFNIWDIVKYLEKYIVVHILRIIVIEHQLQNSKILNVFL